MSRCRRGDADGAHDGGEVVEGFVKAVVDDEVVEFGGVFHLAARIGNAPRDHLRAVLATVAQALEQRCGIQRRIEAGAPAARQVDLEHVAGGQVVEHAHDAVETATKQLDASRQIDLHPSVFS